MGATLSPLLHRGPPVILLLPHKYKILGAAPLTPGKYTSVHGCYYPPRPQSRGVSATLNAHCDPCPPAASTFSSRKWRSSLSVVATYYVPTDLCHRVPGSEHSVQTLRWGLCPRPPCLLRELVETDQSSQVLKGPPTQGSDEKPRGPPAAEQEKLESRAFGQRNLSPPRTTACKTLEGGHNWLPWTLPCQPSQSPGGVGRAR